VVRLKQGDPKQETKYADDPLAVAQRWQDAGAEWLHVVNLDGAFDEQSQENQTALERILTTGLQVQFGGGVRDARMLRRVMGMGVNRVIIGTAAVEEPDLVDFGLRVFGTERIAVGIDARRNRVRTHGWGLATSMPALALARHSASQGVRWIIFTDVVRDGTGSGLNLEATTRLALKTDLHVIASGGVASLDDVRQTYEAGLSGVIIGRALYEGQVALEDALRIGTDKAVKEE
jgi:phosphoribosylformimino-5-aminoimidazole carboxamide ribotide isomerase